MLRALSRLRVARHLAFLAMLLLVGLGQHAHAAGAHASLTASPLVEAAAPGADDTGPAHPACDTHCGACHLSGAVAPRPSPVRVPQPRPLRPAALVQCQASDVAAPDEPARPPRLLRPG